MRPLLLIATAALCLTPSVVAQASPQDAPPRLTTGVVADQSTALSQLLDSYAMHRGFSGTALIARGGKVLLQRAYGKADVEWSVPSDPAATYRIGSLSKPLTATLVMQLVQQNQLRLDSTLGVLLPEIYKGTSAEGVTVAQLLSHTSGIADLPGRYDDPWWQTSARQSSTPLAFAREWIKPTMVEKPGEKWRYNNNGFFLLGVIVERVTGKSLADNLRERIFNPAGMMSSGLFSDQRVLAHLANGYTVAPDGTVEHPLRIDPSVSFAAAGIYSTAEDLYRFDRALYGTKLVSAETRATMMERHSAFYGFGWGVEDWPMPSGKTLRVVSHTGSVPGYQSYYLRSEANQDCVIILDNFWQGALVSQMGKDLMEVLNGKPMQAAKRSMQDLLVPVDSKQGLEGMIAAYNGLGPQREEYDMSEGAFNALGYQFLRGGHTAEDIQVFHWAAGLFPQSANVHDSLGEAYRKAGRHDDAVRSYSEALALDPKSVSARQALDELNAISQPH